MRCRSIIVKVVTQTAALVTRNSYQYQCCTLQVRRVTLQVLMDGTEMTETRHWYVIDFTALTDRTEIGPTWHPCSPLKILNSNSSRQSVNEKRSRSLDTI